MVYSFAAPKTWPKLRIMSACVYLYIFGEFLAYLIANIYESVSICICMSVS